MALRGQKGVLRGSPWPSVDKEMFFAPLRAPSRIKKRCSSWPLVALRGQKRCSPRPPRPPRTKRDVLRAPPQAIPTPNSNCHRPAQSHQRTIAPPMPVVYLAPFPGYRPTRSLHRQQSVQLAYPDTSMTSLTPPPHNSGGNKQGYQAHATSSRRKYHGKNWSGGHRPRTGL